MDGFKKRTQKKKAAILRAAQELFFSHGITNTSVNQVAVEAGVSPVTIYNYFGSKEKLVQEMMRDYMDKMMSAAETILDSELSFEEVIKSVFKYSADKQKEMQQDFLNSIAWGDPTFQKMYSEYAHKRGMSLIQKLVKLGQRDGSIEESLRPEAVVDFVSAFLTILMRPDFMRTNSDYKKSINHLFFYGLLGQPLPALPKL